MQDVAAEATRTIDDRMDPARAAALHAVLGLPGAPPREGQPLPPFFHLAYFWDVGPPETLGADGHPRTGGLVPDTGLPRRMWAGGRLTFHAALRTGIRAAKTSACIGFARKTGRSGHFALVTLRHEIRQRGALVLTEEQDVVYRPAHHGPDTATAPVLPVTQARSERTRFDEVALFRYSALTMNAHRVHYDLAHARDEAGHGGLLVHGPLLATRLALLAERTKGTPLRHFHFRARSPLICGEEARLFIADGGIWATGGDGRLCMEADAG